VSLLPWAVIAILTIINALYVAAEFAAVSVRHSQVRQLAQDGNSLAQRLWPVLQDSHSLDRYIAACQIGITLTSLGAGAYGQATIARDFSLLLQDNAGLTTLAAQSSAALITLVLITVIQVVFGELVPKSLALQFPTNMALYTYWPMRWSLVLYAGFIAFLNGSGLLLLKLLGMGNVGGHRHIHSPEEIEMLIAESRDGGLLEPDEQERLHHALVLSRRTARQLMVPRRMTKMLDVNTPFNEVLQTAIESPYTRLPIYRDSIDNVIGLMHTKDLAARYAQSGTGNRDSITSIEEVMRPITSVPSSVSADQLLKMLRERRSRLAVVMDEYGGVEGIVTLEDVLNELLGDIADEFKSGNPEPEQLPDGRVRVPGILRLDEVLKWAKAPLEHEEVDTIAGLVVTTLGHLPLPGEAITVSGVKIEVEHMDGQAVQSLIITPRPDDYQDDTTKERDENSRSAT